MARGFILIVEDDEDIRDTIAGILRDEGYRIATSPHGLDALGLLERADDLPSVILLDLMMPTMSGWEFRARQRGDRRLAGVPVVILTSDPRAREIGSELDAAAWIKKPMSITGLLDAIGRALPAA